MSDGGSEFLGDFEKSTELNGILQVVIDSDSPWQNGKCERHGGLLKDLLDKAAEGEVIRASLTKVF